MIRAPIIGKKFTHLKRGGTYTIVGEVAAMGALPDNTQAALRVWHDEGQQFTYLMPSELALGTGYGAVLEIQVMIQNSSGVYASGVRWLLYQSTDHYALYARPMDEFLDGRFKELIE